MVSIKKLANWEKKLSPLLNKFPSKTVVSKYSNGRRKFLEKLKSAFPNETYIPPKSLKRTLWGIEFKSPIMNAAGMFKNGEGSEMVEMQGAGAYIGGTGTYNPRVGNHKEGIILPFMPFRKSHSAANWLGLPNDGDEVNSERAFYMQHIREIPIAWSVMASPSIDGKEKLEKLVSSLDFYDKRNVDFLEINASCPNVKHNSEYDKTEVVLNYVSENFLNQRSRKLPVVVKFSNDTNPQDVPYLMDLLFELGFDGINFGNTSINYSKAREHIHKSERKHFDYFTKTFGGGISGKPLKESSLELSSLAVEYKNKASPSQEFHIFRTGGIDSWRDIQQSEQAGVSMNQWYTGYFEQFAEHGHDVYKELFRNP